MSIIEIHHALGDALKAVLRNISQTGLWLDGTQRVAIAQLARHAREAGLGATAKAKLSPSMVDWRTPSHGLVSPPLVEAARRIAVDASRLTEQVVQGFFGEGVHPGEYAETIAVVASITALDTFHRGMGYPLVDLVDPDTGASQRVEPSDSVWDREVCWLPTVPPDVATGELAAWYSRGHDVGNLFRTITYAPHDAATFFSIQGPMYAEGADLWDFANSPLALHKTQVEVIATRVSSFNDCFYCTTGHTGVLRASARSNNQDVDIDAVRNGVSTGDPHIDTLMALSEAILTGDNLDDLRKRGRELLGPDAYRDAVAVAAYFDAINRIADAAGAVVDNDNIRLKPDIGMGEV